MSFLFPVCEREGRPLDGFDLITLLGLVKEYNWQEMWRRYLPADADADEVSMYVDSRLYFVELHVQKMRRIILSEKFNTNPFFMQQVIQRILASHGHELILAKIRGQGIDTGDNPICLSCSLGNVIIDLIANRNETPAGRPVNRFGSTHIEEIERRPLDVYDLSSILYLCQQNLSDQVFSRYSRADTSANRDQSEPRVDLAIRIGDYQVGLVFNLLSPSEDVVMPAFGNASVFTMHQVVQRMNFRHSEALILEEMDRVGLPVTMEQISASFTLSRYVNNTFLQLDFAHV